MSSATKRTTLIAAFMLAVGLMYTNCSGERVITTPQATKTGNPIVPVDPNARLLTISPYIGPRSITLCFERLRFEAKDGSTQGDVTLQLGEVTLNPAGTVLADVVPPTGEYERIRLDLDDDCPSDKSLQVTNAFGTFTTEENVTLTFEGDFDRVEAGAVLQLGIQKIANMLSTVKSDAELKARAEQLDGESN
ncbi:MAG TPA: hypothetical protein VFV50_17605 [Bdellovibrionales bacterium]|nr:hypothetical protein [Bdellovibrionales bacterium]